MKIREVVARGVVGGALLSALAGAVVAGPASGAGAEVPSGPALVWGQLAQPSAEVHVLALTEDGATESGLASNSIATTSTDSEGRLSVPSSAAADGYAAYTGMVEIDALDADGSSQTWVGQAGSEVTPAATAHSSHGLCYDEFGTSTQVPWHHEGWDMNRYERYVMAYGRPAAPVHIQQDVGDSHTLGIGITLGDGAGWQVSGGVSKTMHESDSSGQTFKYAKSLFNSVNYERQRRLCYSGRSVYPQQSWAEHMTHPYSFAAFITKVTPTAEPHQTAYCITKSADYDYLKDEGSNTRFEAGVDLGYISVFSQNEFSSNFTEHWQFTGGPVHLCGSSSFGLKQSAVVAAQRIYHSPNCVPGKPCDPAS